MTETAVSSKVKAESLPNSWLITNISATCRIFSGFGFPKRFQGRVSGEIPFFKVRDISKAITNGNRILTFADNYISYGECSELRAKTIPRDTVVFAKIGEAIRLNRRAILGQESLVDNNVMGVLARDELLEHSFLYYFMTTVRFADVSRATAVPSIRKSDVEQLSIPLPPLAEQRRIVEKIEELFTRLDAGVESLKKAQALLNKYRQSVLKAAVTGELSREWREEHADELEPASELLKRILEEQREKRTASEANTELPHLPEQWTWTTVAQLGEVTGGLTKNRQRAALEIRVPYLRVANVYSNRLFLEEVAEIGVKKTEFDRVLLQEGDLLVVEGNGSPDQIGRVAVWGGSISPCVHQNHLIKVRLPLPKLSWWVLTWLLSVDGREHIRRVASSTSGLYTLSLAKVRNLAVPLPPLVEQVQILEELDQKLSVADKVEATVEENLQRSESLRQSILKWAFSGKLVPQDPDDEPASVLLERIREERLTTNQKSGKRRRSKADASDSPSFFSGSEG